MTQDELKMVLEALKWSKPHEDAVISHSEAIIALEEALAQPEQEPVGQLLEDAFGRGQVMWFNKPKDESMLYTTPPQRTEPVIDQSAAKRIATALGWTPPRTWVGLTDEEFHDLQIENIDDPWANFKAIEAKLKQKNGHST